MEGSWPCNGPLEDGSTCPQILTARVKFCPECGFKNKPPDVKKPEPEYSWPCPQQRDDGRLCGEELMARYRFCPSCGKEVGSPVCRHCLSVLDKVRRFCSECGGSLVANVSTLPRQEDAGPMTGSVPKPPHTAEMLHTKSLQENIHGSTLQDPEEQVSEAAATSLSDPFVSMPEVERKPPQGLHLTLPSSGTDQEMPSCRAGEPMISPHEEQYGIDERDYEGTHNQPNGLSVETALLRKRRFTHVTGEVGDVPSPPRKTTKASEDSVLTQATTPHEASPLTEATQPLEASQTAEKADPNVANITETTQRSQSSMSVVSAMPDVATVPPEPTRVCADNLPHEATRPREATLHHEPTRPSEATLHHEPTRPNEATLHHEPTKPSEATLHHEPTKPSESTLHESTKPSEATLHHEPTRPSEATLHHDPTKPSEATLHHESTKPSEATLHHEPTKPSEATLQHDTIKLNQSSLHTEAAKWRQGEEFNTDKSSESDISDLAREDLVDGDTCSWQSLDSVPSSEPGLKEANRVTAETVQQGQDDGLTNRNVFSGGRTDRSGVVVHEPAVFGQQFSSIGKVREVPCKSENQHGPPGADPQQRGSGVPEAPNDEMNEMRKKRLEYFLAQQQPVRMQDTGTSTTVTYISEVSEPGVSHGSYRRPDQRDEMRRKQFEHTRAQYELRSIPDRPTTPGGDAHLKADHQYKGRACEVPPCGGAVCQDIAYGIQDIGTSTDEVNLVPEGSEPGMAHGSYRSKWPPTKDEQSIRKVPVVHHETLAGSSVDGPYGSSPRTCVDGTRVECVGRCHPEPSHHPDYDKNGNSDYRRDSQVPSHGSTVCAVQTHPLQATPQREDYQKSGCPGSDETGSQEQGTVQDMSKTNHEHTETLQETRNHQGTPKGPVGGQKREEPSPKKGNMRGEHPPGIQQNLPGTAYNKRTTSAELYIPPTTRGRSKQNQATQSLHEQYDCMTVHFHILVESAFKYDRKAASVYLGFGDDRMGNFNTFTYELKPVRDVQDVGVLLSGDVPIPLPILRKYTNGLQYKYILIRKGNGESLWENIKGYQANRRLNIPQGLIKKAGSYHRYDGIMLRQPEGENMAKRAMKGVGNWILGTKSKNCKALATSALQEMLPSWDGFCTNGKDDSLGSTLTAHDALMQLHELRSCMNRWPVCEDLDISDKDNCFKEVLKEYIRPRIDMFKESVASTETPEESSLRMASAVTVVMLIDLYKLEYNPKTRRQIFGALQIRPTGSEVCHDYEQLIKVHFPGKERMLADQLMRFIRSHVSQYNDDFRWLKCVPLLHFLQGTTKPFEKPPVTYSTYHRTSEWWGIEKMTDVVHAFKKGGFIKRESLKNFLATLAPLYKIDWLLPRTILASLSHQNIETVIEIIMESGSLPLEAALAMIYFHMKDRNIHQTDFKNYIPSVHQLVTWLSSDKALQFGEDHAARICAVAYAISIDYMDLMVEECQRHSVGHDAVITMIYVVLQTIVSRKMLMENRVKERKSELNFFENKLIDRASNWLHTWLPVAMMITGSYTQYSVHISTELNVWSSLLSISFQDAESDKLWKTRLLNHLKTRLTMEKSFSILEIFSHHLKFEVHCQDLVECCSEFAFNAAEDEMMRGGGYLEQRGSFNSRLWKIFSKAFMKIWPSTEESTDFSHSLLKHILTLPSFKRFLHFFTNEAASQVLDEKCQQCLAQANSLLFTVVRDLASGDIRISQLYCILENPEALIENAAAAGAWCAEVPSQDVLRQTIEWRKKELNLIDVYKNNANALRWICTTHIGNVDTFDLENQLGQVGMDLKVSVFCDCVKYDVENKQFDKDQPKVTFFGFSADVEKKIDDLLKLQKSSAFLMILKETGQACLPHKSHDTTELLPLQHVFNEVWPKAERSWNTICQSVQQGSLTLHYVQYIFKSFYSQEDRLKEELQHMFANKEDPQILERLQQIQRYSMLSKYEDGAKAIMEAKKRLHLTGDFSMLEKILNATKERTAQLKSMTVEVVKAGESLKGMQDGHIQCIKVYIKAQPLVAWLREHIKKVQELKAFVDLALISATGKGDLEITKVSCLHAAVSGFAPLIYDLKENSGFDEFYTKCKAVWRVYDADQNLPKKLVDLHDELEWLKGVNDAQGDVEVNALKQVAAINSRGIYIIQRDKAMHIEDVIRVIVPAEIKDKGKEKEKLNSRTYTLSDLKELQSKLMLVAGKAEKGNEDVGSFVEKFDGITGLANTFVSICSAGNILFKTWTAKFYCDPNRRNNAVIDFGLSEHKLSGSVRDTNVTQQINQVRQFIESCLNEWKDYIEKERTEFPELNHYTTEQLVILRGELAKLASGQDAETDLVLALLQDVRPDCNMKHIQTACREAAIQEKPEDNHGEETNSTSDSPDEDSGDTGALRGLEEVYGRGIVARAREMLKDEDIDAIELKCMELEEEELDHQMDVDTASDNEDVDMGGLQAKQSMRDMTGKFLQQLNEQKSNLREKLDNLWQNVHTSSAKSMADYLSIEHLGRILQHLSENNEINRSLPPYLKQGQPNLIVCSGSDVLGTVVSVYMEDEKLPLPTRNEVLLCDENTSPEEVELLVRRAVSDGTGRIFMLVNIQLLNYEVAAHVEKAIEKHTQGQANYNLVVICSSEQQDRSQLVTALDSYRVHTPVRPPLDRLKAYLQKHLKGNTEGILSACQVDPENCCVRVVRSDRSGTGKTLWMKRRMEELLNIVRKQRDVRKCQRWSLPLYGKTANINRVLDTLLPLTQSHNHHVPSLYHFNIPHEMQEGVDHLLFNLIVLGSLVDPLGYAWRRNCQDFYVIEIMPLLCWEVGASETLEEGQQSVHHCLELLPTVMCRSPQQSLEVLQHEERPQSHDQLMDLEEFASVHFQRVFQYLFRLHTNADLRGVDPFIHEGTPIDCLHILLRYCGLEDPSWAELVHFVRFLNVQLASCERSSFCSIGATSDDTLPGFLRFVVRFMIQMSKDFSTRSLNMAEETNAPAIGAAALPKVAAEGMEEELVQFQLKRRWETSPHPYIFFNPDGVTMTFLGFIVKKPNFDVVDARTNAVLEEKIMNKQLFDGLLHNGVNLSENFDALSRDDKIKKLCMVMGNDTPHDPDDKYVLTADNVKKILAIQMRFRCNIPVVIMGETGCGKTELIKFMCRLQCPPGRDIKNMLLMKVHGGTTEDDLVRKVREAQKQAARNQEHHPGIHTVLFLDEVNTTEALGLVKEVLCDHMLNGEPLTTGSSLRLIAACNPYRKHSQEVIEKLEQAGLGYHVKANQTTDKLGRIPMRRLVYRVQPLPQSLLPLVWDFGQLPPNIEQLYIQQIVKKKLATKAFDNVPMNTANVITNVLVAAQNFMRNQQDECSFVSLRDVKRAMDVMAWFYHQRDTLFVLMDEHKAQQAKPATTGLLGHDQDESDEEDGQEAASEDDDHTPSDLARSLILALGVCYHACLQEKREEFRDHVCELFEEDLELVLGPNTIEQEISLCQDVFLNDIELGPNIARNQALKENVFMMVVCIELRIPLFLVGKPGSSKSLAKTIVMDAMQGPNSHSELFKKLKQVYMVSYQCSPLSTPDGIVSIFGQCAQLQKDKEDLDKFVAVVVLDEIGLAEDSPRMPLKTLHPLLEDGCAGDEEQEERHKKVGFIGISNWALDPAKMNRGILVQRGPPDETELEQTATDICSSDETILKHIIPLMRPLAAAYTELYDKACDIREFYGLRDFYSLVKMVYGFAKKSKRLPTWQELTHAVLRNFGGLDSVQPVDVFRRHIQGIVKNLPPVRGDPDNTPAGLIRTSLDGSTIEGESRYLLVLTENYAALQILQQDLDAMRNAIIIFGSSFPKDQDYVVVCRNINRIKVCMETGQTVVLLNLESLYESLYDALNQYYTYFGGQRHVDLGLGSHRVKSRVHQDFKLIVVAEKDVVYKKFPIPLINRLEKHFVAKSTMLTGQQERIVERLSNWTKSLARIPQLCMQGKRSAQLTPSDIFIGYHHDTCATVVLQVCHQKGNEGDEKWAEEVFRTSKEVLLQCATPEAIIRTKKSQLSADEEGLMDLYFTQQQHDSLIDYLKVQLNDTGPETAFIQVTTHSRLLSNKDVLDVARALGLPPTALHCQVLHAFNTEQQFYNLLRGYFTMPSDTEQILIIQCDSGEKSGELIACTRYMIREEFNQAQQNLQDGGPHTKRHILIIVQLPRVAGGCFIGFQGGMWKSVHLDDLRAQHNQMPPVAALKNQSVSTLVRSAIETRLVAEREEVDMDVDPATEDADMEDGLAEDELIVNPRSKFDYHQLLRSCVHGAAAMLKDKVDMANSTARVHKLLSLLPETPQEAGDGRRHLTFGNVLKERVYLLLKDKEDSKMVGTMASDWLINEVASVDAINKAGTFRRAVWEYLETKITPILAGLIAFVDTNNNLVLVTEDNWKQRMWLSVFRNPQLTPMVYNDLVSAKRATELKELPVQMKGVNGTVMCGQLPFSWLLKSYVDDLINQKKKERVGDKNVSRSVGHVLKQSPWWPVLEAAFEDADAEIIKDCYLDDFVRMVYKPQTENALVEYTLVKRALRTALSHLQEPQPREEDMEDTEEEEFGLEHLIPMVHVAEADIHGRIQLFADVLAQHPTVLEDLQQFLVNEPKDPLSSEREMALDVLSVRSVVRNIQPDHKLLRDKETSRNWLRQVEMTSPLVNTILARANNLNTGGLGSYSTDCMKALKVIWSDWNRVSAVKLFVETVCPAGSDQEKQVTTYGPMMFKKLQKANFKTTETMQIVEKFLQTVTKGASKEYLEDVQVCPGCKEQMMVSVVMPCKHEVCEGCLKDLTDAEDFSCFVCKEKYDRKVKLKHKEKSRTQVQKLQVFKQRCNSFLTELVSRMCFAGKTPPEDGVVTMLMGYITKQPLPEQNQRPRRCVNTKAMNLFNDNLDPTPVVRSVLLQLLLRSSPGQVSDHLDHYFEQARDHVKEDKDIIELAILYIQCLEDHYHNTGSLGDAIDRSGLALDLLKRSKDDLKSDVVTQLSGIAKARFGLSVVAEWMIKVHVRKQTPFDKALIDRLIRAARHVCTEEDHPGPSLFLIRQLVRRYSLNELHQVAAVIPWVIPDYAQPDETDTAPDHFVVVGPAYTATRNAMNEGLVDETMEPLTAALTGAGVDKRQHCVTILLAVYREVTSKHVLKDLQKRPPPEAVARIQKACETVPALKDQAALLKGLVENKLARHCPQMEVSPNKGNVELALLEVIVHFMVSMTSTSNKLMKPITALVKDPASMKNSYLPTMPEDARAMVHQALLAARGAAGADENPYLYECPNGHAYVIGNCGRPVTTARCNHCGEAIGGQGYNLATGNKAALNVDTTRPGHSLGSPANRSLVPGPERTMSPACTALIRLLVHLGLFVGANTRQQEVHALITPAIQPAEVPVFLWQHLLADLEVVSRSTGKGMDDTLLLVHLYIQHVTSTPKTKIQRHDQRLATKQDRSAWESEFAQQFVMPLLNNLDERLRGANNAITKDDRQSNNALRRHVHESEEQAADIDVTNHLEQAPAIWRYRTRVSIEHLTQELGENVAARRGQNQQDLQQHQVLHLFLKKEPLLRVVRLIPYILRFITILTERYHRRIDRSEADELTIKHFFKEIKHGELREKAEALFNHFVTAWTAVHTNLQTHGRVLPTEYCNQKITLDTRLSTFLPSLRDRGLCTVALLHYLSSVHNEFMDEYNRITKTTPRPDVSFLDLTAAHLISYDPDRDLLPMVVANCTYSLEVGHGTRIEYNFRSLEQQLTERFIKGKAMLTFQLEHVSYREELNNAALFKTLRKKIPQKPLSLAVRDQIRGDCHYMMEISDCLSSLDIAIGFLVSVGGDPETSLSDFMTKTLEMDAGALTQMARRHSNLCHSQALWLLLSHEREKMAARHKQEPFTSVDTREYRVELKEEEEGALCRALTHVDVDRFLSELHECIVLHLTITADHNDEDYVDNRQHLLADELVAYIEDKDGTPIPALTNGTFLKDIKVEQCVDTWGVAFNFHEINNGTVRRF